MDAAGAALVVVDVRNPDFEKEPGDGATHKAAPIGDPSRKAAVNIVRPLAGGNGIRSNRGEKCCRRILELCP